MSGYFLEFNRIAAADVCNWLFRLEAELNGDGTKGKSSGKGEVNISLSLSAFADLSIIDPKATVAQKKVDSLPKRVQHLSETSDCGSTDSSTCDFWVDECDLLQEMFPDSSLLEVRQCVTIANGDLEKATQILLYRQENDQSIVVPNNTLTTPKPHSKIDDAELKNRIIARWVETDMNGYGIHWYTDEMIGCSLESLATFSFTLSKPIQILVRGQKCAKQRV